MWVVDPKDMLGEWEEETEGLREMRVSDVRGREL